MYAIHYSGGHISVNARSAIEALDEFTRATGRAASEIYAIVRIC
jgi:hypothetical protein